MFDLFGKQKQINDCIYLLWANHPSEPKKTGKCPKCGKKATKSVRHDKANECSACAEFDLSVLVGYKDAKAYHDCIRKLRKLEDYFKRIY